MVFLKRDKHEQPLFKGTLIILLCSYIGFIIFKYFKKNMESYAGIPTQDDKNIPLVRSSRDLAFMHGNYFIFSDKVYDINKVISNHPGGFDVISHVRGK